MLLRLAPAMFVLLWSTGWIVAQAASPYADPLTFLLLRYLAAAGLLAAALTAAGRALPSDPSLWVHGLASGVLLHALYLGGVWWAIDQGVPTPLSGLIAAVQPLLTAALAVSLIGERLSALQWLGLALGLGGLALGLAPSLVGTVEARAGADLDRWALLLTVNVAAMASVTLGTLYQKRFLSQRAGRGQDLPAVALTQYVGAAIATAPAAFLLEEMRVDWTPQALAAFAWSVVALSLGAIGLLLLLIRHGEVSRAASLIYLVPGVVAIQAWLYFNEALSPGQVLGLLIAATGVYLINRPARVAAPARL